MLTKLLLLPCLVLFLIAQTRDRLNPLVFSGLFFSFIGDLLLSGSGELFFLLGMLAFIGTHVCNSLFFLQLQKGKSNGGENVVLPATSILLLVSGIVFWQLKPYLGSFQWPILVYMGIINIMAVLATRTMKVSFLENIAISCFIPGAILFVLSDATLAINKFLIHQTLVDIPVMLMYGGAQYFLVKGFSNTLVLR